MGDRVRLSTVRPKPPPPYCEPPIPCTVPCKMHHIGMCMLRFYKHGALQKRTTQAYVCCASTSTGPCRNAPHRHMYAALLQARGLVEAEHVYALLPVHGRGKQAMQPPVLGLGLELQEWE